MDRHSDRKWEKDRKRRKRERAREENAHERKGTKWKGRNAIIVALSVLLPVSVGLANWYAAV